MLLVLLVTHSELDRWIDCGDTCGIFRNCLAGSWKQIKVNTRYQVYLFVHFYYYFFIRLMAMYFIWESKVGN